jgi:hypothetical protein
VTLHRTTDVDHAVVLLNLGPAAATAAVPTGRWRTALDTAAAEWGGPGSEVGDGFGPDRSEVPLAPWSAVLLVVARSGS